MRIRSGGAGRAVWLLAAALTLLSAGLHVAAPSTWDESEDRWRERAAMHATSPVFAARPLTTGAVSALHEYAGWDYRTGFFAVQFGLLLLCGPAVYRYLRSLRFEERYCRAGMVVFYLSLPVVLAHFEPMHTWDDLWVYLLVPLGFSLTLEGRVRWGAAALAAAIVARESSGLFLVPWVLLLLEGKQRGEGRQAWGYGLGVLMAAGLIRWALTGMAPGETHWELGARMQLLEFNFESFERGRDTVFSLLAAHGAVWLVASWGLFSYGENRGRMRGWMRIGGFWTVVGFTVPTLWLMQARETRLFFPAFVFLLPVALMVVREREEEIREYLRGRSWGVVGVWGIGLAAGGIGLARAVFADFEYRKWQDGNWVVLGLHIAAAAAFGLLAWRGRRQARERVVWEQEVPTPTVRGIEVEAGYRASQ